jgi:predicted nucleotidyltransferase
MNYHSNEWIMDRVQEHYNEALTIVPEDRIVCLMLCGAQNYGLETEKSDIDTRLVLTPSFYDIVMNKQPISTTHIRANEEHIDLKDLRLMLNTLRKQNLNFLECLFTPYYLINHMYEDEWNCLLEEREAIAHYDPVKAVKSMWGLSHKKYEQLENNSPSHAIEIAKYGYSAKELHHLLRIEEYLERYINGESYEDCLLSNMPDFLKEVKLGKAFDLKEARTKAITAINHIDAMCNQFLEYEWHINEDVDKSLDGVQYEIMKIAIKKEIGD